MLAASLSIASGRLVPVSAAPDPPKPTPVSPASAPDARLAAALRNPALSVPLSERRASVSKLTAYVKARTAAEKAYDEAVAAAKAAHRAAPLDPFRADREPDYYQMYLQEMRERAFPNDTVDTAALVRADNHRDAMPATRSVRHSVVIRGIDAATLAANPSLYRKPSVSGGIAPRVSAAAAGAQWESVGPRNMLNGSGQVIYYGPTTANFSGRINGMAVSPADPNTVFVATGTGGVWKTTNAGVTFAPIADAFLARQETNTIAIDPFNAQNILVGLGDAQGGEGFGTSRGVLRSTDGGNTWAVVPLVPGATSGDAVNTIVFDRDTQGAVLATTGATRNNNVGYRWRSTDGGVTWAQIPDPVPDDSGNSTRWSSLSASLRDAASNRRYYYSTGMSSFAQRAGLWRSVDQGQTWTKIELPTTPYNGGTVSYTDGFRAAASAVDPNIVYVLRASDKALIKGVRNPADDTYAWTEISGVGTPGAFAASTNWGQTFYNVYLNCAAQPVNGVLMDALYPSLWSINCALGVNDPNWKPNWVDFGRGKNDDTIIHVDNHFSVVAPSDPSRVYVGNDGGFYPVTYTDPKAAAPTLANWATTQGRNANLPTTLFYQADFHPYNANFMLGGLQDNGGVVARGDLGNWSAAIAGDGTGASQDTTNPLRGYLMFNNLGVTLTQDGWASNTRITPPFGAGDARPLIGYCGINPASPGELYVGSNFLWRLNPLKGKWEPRLGNVNLTNNATQAVRAIAVAPSKSTSIYAGTPNGLLWASFDNGGTWKQLSTNPADPAPDGTLPNRAVTSISVNAANDKDILVTLSGTGTGRVYRCADTSQATVTFQNLSGTGATGLPDVPFNTLARDFDAPNTTWYAGADNGVYQTTDGGATWTNATQPLGLPAVSVRTLKAMPGTGYLMAATYGRGIYRIPLVSPLPTDTSPANPRIVFPSPVTPFGSYGDGDSALRIAFSFGNIGGSDATGVTVDTFNVTINGVDVPAQSPGVTLPAALGTARAGAGAVSLSYPIKVAIAAGAKVPATVHVTGSYTTNGTVTPFTISGRVELVPTPTGNQEM